MPYYDAASIGLRAKTKDDLNAILYSSGLAEKFTSWDEFIQWVIRELREEYDQ